MEYIRLLKIAKMLLEQDVANIEIDTGKYSTNEPNSVKVLSQALDICNESGSKQVNTTMHYTDPKNLYRTFIEGLTSKKRGHSKSVLRIKIKDTIYSRPHFDKRKPPKSHNGYNVI